MGTFEEERRKAPGPDDFDAPADADRVHRHR